MRTSTSTPTSSNASPADRPPALPSDHELPAPLGLGGRVATIVVMAAGSVAMWLGVPIGLIYGVSKLVDTQQPTIGPYLVILFGVPLGMTAIGKGLASLDRWYGRRTGTLAERRRATWLKSMRGERAEHLSWKVLDVVMVWSVATALVGFGVWFALFAGSSLPGV